MNTQTKQEALVGNESSIPSAYPSSVSSDQFDFNFNQSDLPVEIESNQPQLTDFPGYEAGFISPPALLCDFQAELGISDEEVVLFLHLYYHHRHNKENGQRSPIFKSDRGLAAKMGIKLRCLQNRVAKAVKNGLLEIYYRGGIKHYSVVPLEKKLSELYHAQKNASPNQDFQTQKNACGENATPSDQDPPTQNNASPQESFETSPEIFEGGEQNFADTPFPSPTLSEPAQNLAFEPAQKNALEVDHLKEEKDQGPLASNEPVPEKAQSTQQPTPLDPLNPLNPPLPAGDAEQQKNEKAEKEVTESRVASEVTAQEEITGNFNFLPTEKEKKSTDIGPAEADQEGITADWSLKGTNLSAPPDPPDLPASAESAEPESVRKSKESKDGEASPLQGADRLVAKLNWLKEKYCQTFNWSLAAASGEDLQYLEKLAASNLTEDTLEDIFTIAKSKNARFLSFVKPLVIGAEKKLAEKKHKEISGWTQQYLNEMRIGIATIEASDKDVFDEIARMSSEKIRDFYLQSDAVCKSDPGYQWIYENPDGPLAKRTLKNIVEVEFRILVKKRISKRASMDRNGRGAIR